MRTWAKPASSRRLTTAPPSTSLRPPRYFVVACMTRSQPRSSGRCSAGEAKVLSATARAPLRCAIAATSAMSTHCSSGFDGVSIQTRRVASLIAPRDVVEPGHVDEARGHAPLREQVLENVRGAVVDVARRDHVVARREALEDRGHGGEAGAERRGRGAAFEGGQRRFESVAIGVVVARIEVAARIAAVGAALERGRQVDRLRDRAGGRVDPVPGVNGQGLETKRLGRIHGSRDDTRPRAALSAAATFTDRARRRREARAVFHCRVPRRVLVRPRNSACLGCRHGPPRQR